MYPPSHRPFARRQRMGQESGFCTVHARKRLRADLEVLDSNNNTMRCIANKPCRPRETEEVVTCQLHHRPRNIHHMRMVAPQVYECLPQYPCRPYGRSYNNNFNSHRASHTELEHTGATRGRDSRVNHERGYYASRGRNWFHNNNQPSSLNNNNNNNNNNDNNNNNVNMKRDLAMQTFMQGKNVSSFFSSSSQPKMSLTPFANELRSRIERERVRKYNGGINSGNHNNNYSRSERYSHANQTERLISRPRYDYTEWSAPIGTFTNENEQAEMAAHSRYNDYSVYDYDSGAFGTEERIVWCAYHGKQIALSQSTRLRECCYVCINSNTCLGTPLEETPSLFAKQCTELLCARHGVLRSPAFMQLNAEATGYVCSILHRCREETSSAASNITMENTLKGASNHVVNDINATAIAYHKDFVTNDSSDVNVNNNSANVKSEKYNLPLKHYTNTVNGNYNYANNAALYESRNKSNNNSNDNEYDDEREDINESSKRECDEAELCHFEQQDGRNVRKRIDRSDNLTSDYANITETSYEHAISSFLV